MRQKIVLLILAIFFLSGAGYAQAQNKNDLRRNQSKHVQLNAAQVKQILNQQQQKAADLKQSTSKEQKIALEQKKAEERVKPANMKPQMFKTRTNTGFIPVPFSTPTPQRTPAASRGMVNVTLTAGDIWGDGSGYQLLLDPSATAYGTVIPATSGALYSCSAPSNLYDIFTYKIPTNADPVCSTSNIVVNNSITIQIPAGTYDFCIVNPTTDPTQPNLWIAGSAGNTSARADNFVFQDGKKYTFVMTFNGQNDGVNLTIENDNPNAPKAVTNLTVTPVGTTQATISWTNPTQAIDGTALTSLTAVNLYVNDGTTPVYTNSSPVVGGAGSYTYTIPTPGGYKFTVVASNAAGAGVEASVTHDFCDVITTFPWSEGFEGTYPPACWTPYQNAFTQASDYAAEGTKSIMLTTSSTYYKYGLITPPIAMQAAELSFKMMMYSFYGSSNYYNTVRVKVSTTDNQESSFTTIMEFSTFNYTGINSNNVILTSTDIGGSTKWYEAKVNLSAYAGQTIYVALEAYDHWGEDFYIDDVRLKQLAGSDAAVTAIPAPVNGQNMTATETVTATIQNKGATSITALTMKLQVDGGTVISEPFSGSIAAGGTYNFTFAAKADLSAAGDHTITVTADMTGDGDLTNNTFTKTVRNTICNTITTFPYLENFENVPDLICWSTYNLVSASTYNWVPTTFEAYTGTGSMYSHYDCTNGVDSWLISPAITIPATGKFALRFWSMNDYGTDAEYDGVKISTTGNNPATATFTELKQLTGSDLSDTWQQFTIPLTAYAGQTVYIAFQNQGNCADNWYIDDVEVKDMQDYVDAQLSAIVKPASGPNLTTTEPIQVTVKNNGMDPISGFPVTVTVDGGTPITETINTSVAPLAEFTYTFTAKANLSVVGTHTINASVNVMNDAVADNNSLSKTVTNFGNVMPLQEGDNGSVNTCGIKFTDNGGTDADYSYYDNAWVVFYPGVAGRMIHATMNDLALGADIDQDAFFIFDGAFTQDELFAMTQEEMDAVLLFGGAGDWSSACPMDFDATNPNGALTFYFQWGTWFGYVDRGWDIDISCNFDNDAAITAITAPVSGKNLTAAEPVTATVKNMGVNPIGNINLVLTVDGVEFANNPYTANLAPQATVNYTFPQTADLSAAGNHPITVKVIYTGDENTLNDSKTVNVYNTVCVGAVGLPFNEGFENGMGCWTNLDADGDGFSWVIVSATADMMTANSGDYSAASNSWDPVSGGALFPNNYLISPQLAIPANCQITLTWWAAAQDPDYPSDVYDVMVSTTDMNPTSFTSLYTETLATEIWAQHTLDLSAYAGQNIYIAFVHHNCSDWFYMKIDDVSVIAGNCTNTTVNTTQGINVYPNPVKDNVVIENAAGSHAKIYDISGKVVFETNITNNAQSVNISTIAAGAYFLELQNNNSTSRVKLIKK